MVARTAIDLTFIVPAFNEEAAVAGSVSEIRNSVKGMGITYEILIVDDGSVDKTWDVVLDLSRDGNIRGVRHTKNLGLGAAYKSGVENAQGRRVMMVPGDNAHPADGLRPIIEQFGTADVIIPYPTNPEARSKSRQLVSNAFSGQN